MRKETGPRQSHLVSPVVRPRLTGLVLVLCTSLTLCEAAAGTHSIVLAGAAAHPLGRCKGSTRAHVRVTWPGPAQQAAVERLHWGAHVPQRVRRWAYLFVPQARTLHLDPYLIAAVIRVESDGDPLAWDLDSDARGLMQVLHASFEPKDNIALGVSMLSGFVRQFRTIDLALAAYNAGPGAVEAYGGIPPYTETRDYVVMADYFHDLFQRGSLPRWRTARYRAALADLIAYVRRVCSRPEIVGR